mgnify:CR=1 FL=1
MTLLEEVKKKRGRPVIGCPKNVRTTVRMTAEVGDMFNDICESQGCTKSEALEKMIRNQYTLTKNGFGFLYDNK